jgi:hypothetical protein
MDKPILEILAILQATPADYFIFFMGIVVVLWIITLTRRIKVMETKYHLLNLSNVRLWDRVDPNMVNEHHSGDYSIKLKKSDD